MTNPRRPCNSIWLSTVLLALTAPAAVANQTSIVGPPGSVLFGDSVALLPNGNIVVADPRWTDGTTEQLGAVYLYTSGGQLISKLTGSSADDDVGSQVVVLSNGNFVVGSGAWSLGSNATHVGAVTWVNGTTGLSGTVSASNSLIGSQTNDSIGDGFGVVALPGGNYIVLSPTWSNGSNTFAGAITWGSGTSGVKGAVSASNSLVGSQHADNIGAGDIIPPRVTMLTNGNAVVVNAQWANSTGAVTWIDANGGNHGVISSTNALVGAQPGDEVGFGGAVALANGNYVVSSQAWSNGSVPQAGAATWGNGQTGTVGVVSASNSLVGTKANDQVSMEGVNLSRGITALCNGNYVVSSQSWGNGGAAYAGAVTWANGTGGLSGAVTTSNSLVGTHGGDGVGYAVTALSNGNYVVGSKDWNDSVGAVTWADGASGLVGNVGTNNSLVGTIGGGTTEGDRVGWYVTALTNGNYVVGSPYWNDSVGAVTWLSGTAAYSGTVSASNSLMGSVSGDSVSNRGIVALTNGNYVVDSENWNNGAQTNVGAATWGNGTTAITGTVSASNSLVGSTDDDNVGNLGVFPLANGNYVVASQNWNGSASQAGAVTWVNGSHTTAAAVSSANSLVGSSYRDWIGFDDILTFPNSNYLVASFDWDNGNLVDAGAVSEGRGNGGTVGALSSANSVLGTAQYDGTFQSYDYDATHDLLIVGQPLANVVFLFNIDVIFKNGFEK